MGQLHDKMKADLQIGGYAKSTQQIYLYHARLFAAHFMRSPEEMGPDEIREYFLHVTSKGVSRSTQKQMRAALIFLYKVTLNRPQDVNWLPVPRKEHRLPVILSGTETQSLLDAVEKPLYRAVLMSLYGAGLRISEGCRLTSDDIDSKRMLLRVRAGKGNKDRYTILSNRLLSYLREYWREARPENPWMFPGKTTAGHVSDQSVRRVFHLAAARAGIRKSVRPHTLRHSFAAHLLETGAPLPVLSELLGHASLKSTQIYTHVSIEHIQRMTSPLDLLGTSKGKILG